MEESRDSRTGASAETEMGRANAFRTTEVTVGGEGLTMLNGEKFVVEFREKIIARGREEAHCSGKEQTGPFGLGEKDNGIVVVKDPARVIHPRMLRRKLNRPLGEFLTENDTNEFPVTIEGVIDPF